MYIAPAEGRSDYAVAWTGAGVIAPFTAQTGKRLTIDMGNTSAAFCESGFYSTEAGEHGAFAWTMERALVRVPLTQGTSNYRLCLKASDGHPTSDRKVTLQSGSTVQTVALNDQLRDHVLIFPSPSDTEPMAVVSMTIETWSPQKVLNVPDGRDLGFQFYGLTWEPMALPHRARD